ncbi:MAG: polyribonucleotide nucleotidyltransferase [Bdellovibrionales bacterium]|nr:polyribonucleotide nucleotidyltransferase [Bdellovibrionales bacterium]
MNIQTVSTTLGGKTLTLETGRLAKQAGASVFVSYGNSRVLVTVCSAKDPKPGIDFMPLTVEFAERHYSAGKIPGSFHKREGRPTTEATLSARIIDRPNRPLFPEGYYCDTQVIATIMATDLEADVEMAAAIGAGAALHLSDVPFNGPTATVRASRINGQFVINPTFKQMQEETDLDIVVSGTAKAIMMIEGGAKEASEADCLKAILLGHEEVKKVCAIIEDLRKKAGVPKREFKPLENDASLVKQIEGLAKADLVKALRTKEKAIRYSSIKDTKKKTITALVTEDMKKADKEAAAAKEKEVARLFELLQYNLMREMILSDKIRIDGRDTKTIRPIVCEAGVLPKVHGSSLFTRGETQVLSVATLGTADDEQIVDTIYENTMKKFMLHYNFPPYSVGETGRFGGTSRREIGHGALAERSISAMLPNFDDFPYTIRLVAETLESNGSSSMGTVCSCSMALMDAGVPYPKPVAGIAMGLIKEGSRVAVLSDILGDEDHLGDMDFKVAGTKDGVTGIQMDIKIEGVDEAIMKQALEQAHQGRLHILGEMAKAISQPRVELNENAPRITTIKVPVDMIGAVIGPSGKVIKDIIAKTGAKVNIEDDGTCSVASNDSAAAKKAIEMIQNIIAVVEVGAVYTGPVKKITDFGAFIGVLPNQDGLLHISEIAYERINNVSDVLKEGDMVQVKVLEVDPQGKVRLSRKALMTPPEGYVPPPPREPRGDRPSGGRGGDRGGRGGGGGGYGGGNRGGSGRGPGGGGRGPGGGGDRAPRN